MGVDRLDGWALVGRGAASALGARRSAPCHPRGATARPAQVCRSDVLADGTLLYDADQFRALVYAEADDKTVLAASPDCCAALVWLWSHFYS